MSFASPKRPYRSRKSSVAPAIEHDVGLGRARSTGSAGRAADASGGRDPRPDPFTNTGAWSRVASSRERSVRAVPPDALPPENHRTRLPARAGSGGSVESAGDGAGQSVDASLRGDRLRLGLLEEHVHRQLEVDRPTRAGERVPERDRDVLRDASRVGAYRRPLRDRLHQRELVELLERTSLGLHERPRAADHDQRHLCGIGVRDGRDGSRHAGACGDDRDPRRSTDTARTPRPRGLPTARGARRRRELPRAGSLRRSASRDRPRA